jgi:hypothetical protein
MFHLKLSEPAEYFNMYLNSRVYASKFPSFGEIHSYLQNSNSTFFLIYAYDYRQHKTSPSSTYSILINTQSHHTPLHFSFVVTDNRRAQTRNTVVLSNLHILAKIKDGLMVIQLCRDALAL